MKDMKDMGAFPAMTPEAGGYSEGMTLRQYYAGQAMMGMLANPNNSKKFTGDIAEWSVRQADALIAELAKEE